MRQTQLDRSAVADHPWRSAIIDAGWSKQVYPFGLSCSRCSLGLDRHPIQPGHVLPTGQYDAAQA
jgi:hypothetical protein